MSQNRSDTIIIQFLPEVFIYKLVSDLDSWNTLPVFIYKLVSDLDSWNLLYQWSINEIPRNPRNTSSSTKYRAILEIPHYPRNISLSSKYLTILEIPHGVKQRNNYLSEIIMAIVGYLPGVFDLLHSGHLSLLKRAQQMCDRLIIGVHTDEFVEGYKRKPHQDQETRKQQIIQKMNFDESQVVLIGGIHTQVIKKYKVTRIIHGDDWEIESYKKQIRYYEDKLDEMQVEVCIIGYTKGISTTDILKNNLPNYHTYQNFYFDLDKTLLLNHQAMPFAVDCVELLQQLNKNIYVLTNNNRYSPGEISLMLNQVGIPIKEGQIISSLVHVAKYLQKHYMGKKVTVWGTDSAKEYLKIQGICLVEERPEVVVVLYRNDYHYQELVQLCDWCGSTPYICGNKDWTYPDATHTNPDTGSIIQMINSCCGSTPVYTCGKPNPEMLGEVLPDSVMIGDSLLTDGPFAENAQIPFIHVAEHPKASMSHLGVLIDYLSHHTYA